MQASSELGSSAVRKWLLATALALGLALSVGALGASAVAAKSKPKHHHTKVHNSTTAVPKGCPSAAEVSADLQQTAGTPTATPLTTAKGHRLTCLYPNSLGAGVDRIILGSPVTQAAFKVSGVAAAKVVTVLNLKIQGHPAWVVQEGNGLSVLDGTLDIVLSFGAASDAELEALATSIISSVN